MRYCLIVSILLLTSCTKEEIGMSLRMTCENHDSHCSTYER